MGEGAGDYLVVDSLGCQGGFSGFGLILVACFWVWLVAEA